MQNMPSSTAVFPATGVSSPSSSFNLPNPNEAFAGTASGQLVSDGNNARERASEADQTPVQIVPDKLLCRGNVTIGSPQVDGTTDRLEMWFKPMLPGSVDAENAGRRLGIIAQPVSGASGGINGRSAGADIPLLGQPPQSRPNTTPNNRASNNASPPVAQFTNPPAAVNRSPLSSSANLAPLGPTNSIPAAPQQHFEVHGKLIRLQAILLGQRMILDDVTIEGNARLDETQTATPGEKPLHLGGDQLQILGAAGDKSIAKVKGKPATVDARGLTLSGEVVQLDRGLNRLWIDGPGTMLLPLDRSLDGRPLAAPRPLEIVWQGKMNFDGSTVQFEKMVDVHTDLQSLKTEALSVMMLKKMDFGKPPQQERPQIGALACEGGVFLESRTVEGQKTVSWERMQTKDLSIDQTSGALLAHGPGWFSSVREGSVAGNPLAAGPLANAAQAANPQPVENASAVGLQYLNVQFLKEITGNINQREMIFHEQVRTIYGPIKDWKDELNADRLEGLGPRGTLLTCQSLKVTEMTARPPARGSVELDARENVMIEAQTFTARAARLSYAQAKDLVVLEGDGRTDAQLFRQQTVGGPTANAAAKKILYWRGTNRVELDDARFLDLGQLGGGAFGQRPANVTAPNPNATLPPRPRTP